MGFTTAAFIRRNTPELRKKLEELGYNILNSGNTTLDAHNYDGRGSHKRIEEGRAIITSYGDLYGVIYDIDTVTKKGRIDCGTNEELFLAIAALRDDTDDSQWFVYPPENSWFICVDDDINYARENIRESVQAAWFHCSHKATVEELIEHFKEKEENHG